MTRGEEKLTLSGHVLPRSVLSLATPCRNAKHAGSTAENNILRKNTNRLQIVPLKHIRRELLYSISEPQKLSLAFSRKSASRSGDGIHCNAANFARHASSIWRPHGELKRHPRQIVAYDAALCKRHITSAVQANRFVPLRLGCGPARLQTSKHFSREMKRYRDELHTCARHKHAFTIFPSPVGGQPPYGPSSRGIGRAFICSSSSVARPP